MLKMIYTYIYINTKKITITYTEIHESTNKEELYNNNKTITIKQLYWMFYCNYKSLLV